MIWKTAKWKCDNTKHWKFIWIVETI